jgi:RNA polymerase sigma-19 factor, ECF subfamily
MHHSDEPEQRKSWGSGFFTDYREKLQRRLRARLRSDQDAQDLAQEAYLRLLRIAEKDFVRHPQTYLFRIAINLVHELYTKELPLEDQADQNELEALEGNEPQPEQALTRQRQLHQVDAALKELPSKCQAVMTMSSRHGMTNKEIAAQLGLSTEMVKKYKAKGIAHCRKRLSRYREDQPL